MAPLPSGSDIGELDAYLATRSYMSGYFFTPADKKVFDAMTSIPDKSFKNAYRWFIHIAALTGGVTAVIGKGGSSAPNPKAGKADEDDLFGDDDDLFGDDDEPKEKPMSRAEQMAKMKADKEAKEKANKRRDRTQIIFEVKGWEAGQDMDGLYKKISGISIPGLTWGEGYSKQPVAFGVFKLVISCVIFDDEVDLDDITEPIEAFEDEVQSVELCTMNKL